MSQTPGPELNSHRRESLNSRVPCKSKAEFALLTPTAETYGQRRQMNIKTNEECEGKERIWKMFGTFSLICHSVAAVFGRRSCVSVNLTGVSSLRANFYVTLDYVYTSCIGYFGGGGLLYSH